MKNIVALSAVGLIILLGGFYYFKSANNSQLPSTPEPSLIQTSQPSEATSATQTTNGYFGKVIAGKSDPFLEFNKKDYDKALAKNKIIVLNFYANWCPICRAEEPAIHEGFNLLTSDQVIGFRVNYNDSDTDADEKALAKQFKITYQHTKVILKNRQEFSRFLDSWDKSAFNKEIGKAIE